MSIPLKLNQESNISNYNLNINEKITSNDNSPEEKNKFHHNHDIKNQLTKEIYFFKNDILKEINEMIEKLIVRFASNFKEINEKFSKNEKKFEEIDKKFSELFEKNENYDKYEERINDLFNYKTNNEKEMKSHKFIFNTIKRDIKDGFQEYDFILKKFRTSHEIVGENRKFQTYPELIRFLFQNFNELSNFQKKNILDFKGYKSKLDSTISTFKQQINVITDAMKNFTMSNVKNCEERIKGILSNYDDRIIEIRSETNVNSENLKKEYEKIFSEAINGIKNELDNKIKNDIIYFNESLKNTKKQLEEKISKYKNDFISLKKDFEIVKTNEDKFIKTIKEQITNLQNNDKKINNNITNNINNKNNKSNNKKNNKNNNKIINDNSNNNDNKNNNSNNNIINSETKENFMKEEKSKSQRTYLNSSKHFKKISNFIENIKNINNTKNDSKKNSFFNLSNNNLKNLNDKKQEIKEEEIEKVQFEVFHSNDRYNLGKSKNEHSGEENEKKIASLKNGLFKKENFNNTIYRIKKIIKHNNQNNNSSDIKDNNIENKKENNKDDLTFRSTKNLFELKDKPLPKLNDIKKKENNNLSRDLKFKAIKDDKKTNTSSFFFHRNNIKNITNNRVLSTNNAKIKQDKKINADLNLDNTTPRKKFNTSEESKNNLKMSIYDLTYIPYKDYDRNKILQEESKKAAKIQSENNIFKKNVNNNKKEYDYINSRGEISNVIEMPPPKDVIYKSIYPIE